MKLITTGIVICMAMMGRAWGDIVLDQQHSFTSSIASSTNGDVTQMGQTFTVGVAGTLDHIDVYMFRLGSIFDPTGDPLLRVYNTADGLPTGAPLATVTIPEANVPLNNAAFVSFDVSSAAIGINVGEVLAFSVTATAGVGPYFLPNDQGQSPGYSGGTAIAKYGDSPWQQFSPPQDHSFKTYVLAAAVGLPGDYNADHVVDAADFVVWRDNLGAANEVALNGNGDGMNGVDEGDYTRWKTNFGAAIGAGASSGVASLAEVPEPATWVLLVGSTLGLIMHRKKPLALDS